jgi:GTP pyrophosphokinase
VDFAYSIHSEVGEHCHSARVNGAIVPLRYKLRNGDVVEIQTKPEQRPNKAWMEFVATGRARSKIRTYVRAEERKQSIKIGRDLTERFFHRKDTSFARFVKSGEVDRVMQYFKVQDQEELWALVGIGKIEPEEIYDLALQNETANDFRPSFIERAVRRVTSSGATGGITIDGQEDVIVRFANCCSPLPGDPVTGWITRGRGVTVHRRGCRSAMELEPERRIDVTWSSAVKVARPVSLRVSTTDKPGILATISAAFTEANINIQEATCRTTQDGQAVNIFHFAIDDAARLQILVRKIRAMDGVLQVERQAEGRG